MSLSIVTQIDLATHCVVGPMVATGIETGVEILTAAGYADSEKLRFMLRAMLLMGFERGVCMSSAWHTAGLDPVPVVARIRDTPEDPGGHDMQRLIATTVQMLREAEQEGA